MPFFLPDSKNYKKRKGEKKKPGKSGPPKVKKSKKIEDEEITSESEHENDAVEREESSEDETPEEMRKRAAEKLLAQKAAALQYNEDNELLSEQLKQEHRERAGRQFKEIADSFLTPTEDDIIWCRWCKLDSVNCIAVMPDGASVFSGSKDGTIVKWNSATGEKLCVIHGTPQKANGNSKSSDKKKQPQTSKIQEKTKVGHSDAVLSLAISYDGKFLVSGGKDKHIYVWNPKDCELICDLKEQRSAIVSLVFRDDSHQLFSCSERISNSAEVKVWNLDIMGKMDSLSFRYLADIDCLKNNNPVIACDQDSIVCVWKCDTGNFLEYYGRREKPTQNSVKSSKVLPKDNSFIHCCAIDCVRYIDEQHAISGANDNSLALWNLPKSRFPVAIVKNAHHGGNSEQPIGCWITAVASFRRSDLAASGSHDGFLRFWKCGKDFQSLNPLFSVSLNGFINGLEFSSKGNFIAAAIGKQQRRGRWFPSFKSSTNADSGGQVSVKNSVCIIRLRQKSTNS